MSKRAREPRRVVLEQTGPIWVQLEEKPAAPFSWQAFWQNRVTWLLLGFSVVCVFLALFLLPVCESLACEGGIQVSVEYPRIISTGDSWPLRLTVQNGAALPLTGTLSLNFLGPLPVQVGEGQSTQVEVEGLPPMASTGFSLSLRVHAPMLFFRSDAVNFSLRWTTAEGTALCRTPEGREVLRIGLAPVHGLQGLSRWLRSTPLSLVALALWEWVKKQILRA